MAGSPMMVQVDTVRDELLGPCHGVNPAGVPYESPTNWYQNRHIGTGEALDEAGRFRYGVAAARVKFDQNVGAHGAFWLQTTQPYVAGLGPAQNGAEIDVVEYFGKDHFEGTSTLSSTTRTRQEPPKVPGGFRTSRLTRNARKALKGDDGWYKRYHVFSVAWTPRAYVFRLDGFTTGKVTAGVCLAGT